QHGLVLLAILLVPVFWEDMPVIGSMRLAWLDGYQEISPRSRRSAPAVIVAIDEESLERLGQWPWPRTLVASLFDRIAPTRRAAGRGRDGGRPAVCPAGRASTGGARADGRRRGSQTGRAPGAASASRRAARGVHPGCAHRPGHRRSRVGRGLRVGTYHPVASEGGRSSDRTASLHDRAAKPSGNRRGGEG